MSIYFQWRKVLTKLTALVITLVPDINPKPLLRTHYNLHMTVYMKFGMLECAEYFSVELIHNCNDQAFNFWISPGFFGILREIGQIYKSNENKYFHRLEFIENHEIVTKFDYLFYSFCIFHAAITSICFKKFLAINYKLNL